MPSDWLYTEQRFALPFKERRPGFISHRGCVHYWKRRGRITGPVTFLSHHAQQHLKVYREPIENRLTLWHNADWSNKAVARLFLFPGLFNALRDHDSLLTSNIHRLSCGFLNFYISNNYFFFLWATLKQEFDKIRNYQK